MPTSVPFPVKIVNQSGLTDPVFITVEGMDPTSEESKNKGQQFFNPLSQGWQSDAVSVLLTDLPTVEQHQVLMLPHIDSGVIFISLKDPLTFDGISPQDPGDVSAPNYETLWDKFEVSYLPGKAPFFNTTNVDFFCLPISLQETVNGSPAPKDGKGIAISRARMLEQFVAQLPPRWAKLMATDLAGDGTIIRVLAPNKALNSPNHFDASFFQKYIDQVWAFYGASANTVVVDMSEIVDLTNNKFTNYGALMTGGVVNQQFVFTGKGSDGKALPEITFNQPAGTDPTNGIVASVFGCDGVFKVPNKTPESVAAKNLAAGFNVGVLASQDGGLILTGRDSTIEKNGWQKLADANLFYRKTINVPPDGEQIECFNLYAKILHEFAAGGFVYAFAFDDVTQKDSSLNEGDATDAVVTIGDATGTVQAPQATDPTSYDGKFLVGANAKGFFGDIALVNGPPIEFTKAASPLKFTYDQGSGSKHYYIHLKTNESSLSGASATIDSVSSDGTTATVTISLPGGHLPPASAIESNEVEPNGRKDQWPLESN